MVMPNLRRMTKKKLGEILLAEGVISPFQLEKALTAKKTSDKLLGEILIAQEACTEKDIAETIATQFSFPYLSTSQYHISADIARLVPVAMMEKYLLVPVDKFGNIVTIAIAGFLSEELLKAIEDETQCQVQVFVATISDVKERIKQIAQNIQNEQNVGGESEQEASSERDLDVGSESPGAVSAPPPPAPGERKK
jgi:type IV pilus assembly protein PilB